MGTLQEDLLALLTKHDRPDEEVVDENLETIKEILPQGADIGDIRRVLSRHGFSGNRRKLIRLLRERGVEVKGA